MLKKILVVTTLLTSHTLLAESNHTLPKTVLLEHGSTQRVCYYQDKAYSEGAILPIGQTVLICQRANKFETNGSLKWNPLNVQTTTPKPPLP
ncbi:DUF1496 domain-containing protein [Vibrio cincinnatiensis]|uniref:DUF1496 domain-containing protein n=1 Tax=Vibrio cincinnatiensis TaxID=675 RepID=UPI001EDD6D7B|nr:DUF1496 domain-containing protein [Vibrio cincinnatiensis]MCG3724324.1 DUF1496 domain-containing protein [Vibrio cincinnatiensis]MCG3731297.1 DUF1496 domain-containing protein [Vibrio cincinnatiensis]MCG3738810.1 DUF1496 domain-containing protein [Vibrio cincinnatiensis]MCG3742336.1 DUF1496 domain-containing protein [Vibrio cincinnatiensis]MCG3764905.1 DUF1496 domain-containing protein [Vibrio cincinnatiensis]